MGRLGAVGRIVFAVGLFPSLFNALGQREGVEEEQLAEALYLAGFFFSPHSLFFVCRPIAFDANQVGQLSHRRSEFVLLSQNVNAFLETLVLEVGASRANRRRGPLKDLAEHHARARPLSAPQAVHRLLVVLCDRIGCMVGCVGLRLLGIYTQNFVSLIDRISRAIFWAFVRWVLRAFPAGQLDNDGLPALSAYVQVVPYRRLALRHVSLATELKAGFLRTAMGAL